jgi:hypothetical protein
MKDSLWSTDLFRCESAVLRTHWILVVMDQYINSAATGRRYGPGWWGPRYYGPYHGPVAGNVKIVTNAVYVDGGYAGLNAIALRAPMRARSTRSASRADGQDDRDSPGGPAGCTARGFPGPARVT